MGSQGELKNIARGRKGQTLIIVALVLVILFVFVGIAVDLGYMYVAKGQLQNAADAAALAAAANLDGTNSIIQTNARNAAFSMASSNKVVPNRTAVHVGHPIPASDTDTGNNVLTSGNPGNDIVVGHWSGTSFSFNNTSTVNAVQVRARRTADSPGGAVDVFFGKILGVVGLTHWSKMSTQAQAVATMTPEPILAIPLCVPTCGLTTPLTVDTSQGNTTPGTRFFLKTQDGSPNIGWTSFLDNSTNKGTIQSYLDNPSTVPLNICSNCLYTTNGTIDPVECDLLGIIHSKGANYNVNGVNVFGWKGKVPILDNTFRCPPNSKTGCLTDPGNQPGDAYRVIAFAEVIVTDAIPPGNCPKLPKNITISSGKPGIVLVGTGPPSGPNTSTLCCVPCGNNSFPNQCTTPPTSTGTLPVLAK
jgi:Flp pilus assembly protein TadG